MTAPTPSYCPLFTAFNRTLDIQGSIIDLLDRLITAHIGDVEERIKLALSDLNTMDVDFQQSLKQGVFTGIPKVPLNVITPEKFEDIRRLMEQGDALNELYHTRTVYSHYICDSLLLTTYAIAERYLLNIAENCQQDYGKKISPCDLDDSGVVAAINYLEKVIEIDPVQPCHQWGQFFRWNKVRNILAHNHGQCSNGRERNAVKQLIEVDKNGFLLTTFDNCRRFIEDSKDLSSKLESTITSKYSSLPPASTN